MTDDLSGVWRLSEAYMERVDNGARIPFFGDEPRGALMLHPSGRMSAVITPRDVEPITSEATAAAAFKQLIAYSGRYRVEPGNRFVTTVDVAWAPHWVGSEQGRNYRIEGDALHIISDASTGPATGSAEVRAILTWAREAD